jgi:hypothetical protein
MRILVDECVDPRVKLLFGDHTVATVREQGCDALEDGLLAMQSELLAAMEKARAGEVIHVRTSQV